MKFVLFVFVCLYIPYIFVCFATINACCHEEDACYHAPVTVF